MENKEEKTNVKDSDLNSELDLQTNVSYILRKGNKVEPLIWYEYIVRRQL